MPGGIVGPGPDADRIPDAQLIHRAFKSDGLHGPDDVKVAGSYSVATRDLDLGMPSANGTL